MAMKGQASRQIHYVHIAQDGSDAISVVVSPQVILAHNGVIPSTRIYVDLYVGEDRVTPDSIGALLGNEHGTTDTTTGLKWDFDTSGGRYGYSVLSVGLKTDFMATSKVTYKGKEYAFCIQFANVKDGANGVGQNGKNGVWVPPIMLWTDYPSNYQFQAGNPDNGDVRLDIVGLLNADNRLIPYRCKATHFKNVLMKPGDSSGKWEVTDQGVFRFVATELLAAKNARIDFLSGQALRVGEGSNMCGYFGAPTSNGVILYSGADNDSDATFRVYESGKVEATDMHLSGNSTFRGFVFSEKTEITAANYSSMSITKELGDGETRTELNLLKTGNWIEISSLPSGQTTHYTSLPSIRIGEAYTDAYREYVRQFMGNELMIYNVSEKSIAIDTGEQSLIIEHERGCYFRMVMAPAKMNNAGNLLERIKWEYTGPFQY